MRDPKDALLAELELLAPADDVPAPHWRDVRLRARPPRRHRRRLTVAVAFGVVAAVLVPALALSARLRHIVLRNGGDVFHTTVQVQVPLRHGWVFRIVTAPWHGVPNGICAGTGFAHPDTSPNDTPTGGINWCRAPGLPSPRFFVDAEVVERSELAKFPRATLAGWIRPGFHAYRLALVWNGGGRPLPARNGYFAAAPAILFRPPRHDLPFAVVAYDIHGNEVARHQIPSRVLYP